MSKNSVMRARVDPNLRRRLERLAERRCERYDIRPNLSAVLREALHVGLDVLEEREDGDDEEE